MFKSPTIRVARVSARAAGPEWRACSNARTDRILPPDTEPPLGSHLVTPRLAFRHHGIYVGNGLVVHYGSFGRLPGGPVAEVPLASFAQGRRLSVRSHSAPGFSAEEVIRRARSRVGENSYRLFTNNCEHFSEWCLHGQRRSYQVEHALVLPALRRLIATAFAQLRPATALQRMVNSGRRERC
jgi:hypothetical protein